MSLQHDIEYYLDYGLLLFSRGEITDARNSWTKALELSPSNEFAKDYLDSTENDLLLTEKTIEIMHQVLDSQDLTGISVNNANNPNLDSVNTPFSNEPDSFLQDASDLEQYNKSHIPFYKEEYNINEVNDDLLKSIKSSEVVPSKVNNTFQSPLGEKGEDSSGEPISQASIPFSFEEEDLENTIKTEVPQKKVAHKAKNYANGLSKQEPKDQDIVDYVARTSDNEFNVTANSTEEDIYVDSDITPILGSISIDSITNISETSSVLSDPLKEDSFECEDPYIHARLIAEQDGHEKAYNWLMAYCSQTPNFSAEISEYLDTLEFQLVEEYQERLGDLNSIPVLKLPFHDVYKFNLDQVRAYILSRMDGLVTIEDVLALNSHLNKLTVLRSIVDFINMDIIEINFAKKE